MPLFAGAASFCTSTRSPSAAAIPSTVRTPARTAVRVAPAPDAPLLYVLAGSATAVASWTDGLTLRPCAIASAYALVTASEGLTGACTVTSPLNAAPPSAAAPRAVRSAALLAAFCAVPPCASGSGDARGGGGEGARV